MSRYDFDLDGLSELLKSEPAYRAKQLFEGLHHRLAEIEELTELPATLRARLLQYEDLRPSLELVSEQQADHATTRKWLFRLHDGVLVETVLMHHPRHSSVCVSSQAGCAMACSFCATGQAGFRRHLSVGEIVEQVVRASRAALADHRRLDHVVFMGMGEPLANYDKVMAAVARIVKDLGIAARHVTISTVGMVPGIQRLTRESLQVNLAVSLHAANDVLRNGLVPINKRYPLERLVKTCQQYFDATHRRISLEWALIADVNDRASDANELAQIANDLRAHVNLIPLNPTPGGLDLGLNGTSPAGVRAFTTALRDRGVNVTVRRTRGRSIDAACGQLAGTRSFDAIPTPVQLNVRASTGRR